jgi:potassium voltage-gated channel Eag-related subfamily H protein 7
MRAMMQRKRAQKTLEIEVAPAPVSDDHRDGLKYTPKGAERRPKGAERRPSARRRSSVVSPVANNYDFDQQLEKTRRSASKSASDFEKLLEQKNKTMSPASTLRKASIANKQAHMEKLANVGEAYLPEHLKQQEDLAELREEADQRKEAEQLQATREEYERIKRELGRKAQEVQDKMKHVIKPTGKWMRTWNAVIAIFLLFTAVVTPYEVSFLETKLDALFFFNQIVTIGFIIDIDVNFHLAYIEPSTLQLVNDPLQIKKRYLRTWFTLDVISTIPYDILALIMDTGAGNKLKIIRILKLLKLTRLLRMVKSMRIFKTLQAKLHLTQKTASLIKVLIILLTSLHWCACLWRLIPELEDVPEDDWVRLLYDNGELNCTLKKVPGEETLTKVDCDPTLLYVICLEFATMIMAMGYPPWVSSYGIPTMAERWVGLAMLFFASALYTYAIGFICSVLSSRNAAVEHYQNQSDLLTKYMKEGNFTLQTRFRIGEYFRQSWQCVNSRYFKAEISTFLPASLQTDAAEASQLWVKSIPFFRVVEPEERRSLLMHLSLAIEYEAFPENEQIYRKGELAKCMYVLRRGTCSVGSGLKTRGECFGMEFLLNEAIRQHGAQAATFVDVAVLTRDALMKMISKNKAVFKETRVLLRKEIRRLAIFQTVTSIGTAAMVIKVALAKGSWKPMSHEQIMERREQYKRRGVEVKAQRAKAAAEERVSQALIAQARKDFRIEQKAEAKAKRKQEREEKKEMQRIQKEEGMALDSDEEDDAGEDEYESYSDEEDEEKEDGKQEEVVACPASLVPGPFDRQTHKASPQGPCIDTCRLCHGSQLWAVPILEKIEEEEVVAPVKDGEAKEDEATDGEKAAGAKGKREGGGEEAEAEEEEEGEKAPLTELEKVEEKKRLAMAEAVDTMLFWAPVAAVRQKRKIHEKVERTGRAEPEEVFWTRFSFDEEERPEHARFFVNELREPSLAHLDSRRTPIDYERIENHTVHETRYWKIDFGRGLDERLSRVRSMCTNRTDEQMELTRQKISRHFDAYDQEMLQMEAALGKFQSEVRTATGKHEDPLPV